MSWERVLRLRYKWAVREVVKPKIFINISEDSDTLCDCDMSRERASEGLEVLNPTKGTISLALILFSMFSKSCS
jgi:hypothetical protein